MPFLPIGEGNVGETQKVFMSKIENRPKSLEKLECLLKNGISIDEFLVRYQWVIDDIGNNQEWLDAYRIGLDPFKRLRDEVRPIINFCSIQNSRFSRVRFPLDDGPIDCFLTDGKNREIGVQITIAFGEDRYSLAAFKKQLDSAGEDEWGDGYLWSYLGVPDTGEKDRSLHKVNRGIRDNKLSNPREAYSTDEAIDAMAISVGTCMKRKSNSKGADILLISAPMTQLPCRCWEHERERLAEPCREPQTKFDEVYLVDEMRSAEFSLRLH